MGAVVHREDAVLESWPERDELAAESFSDAPDPVLEADPAADIDLADNVAWSVFDRRQCFAIGSGTHTIAIGRHREAKRLMRALAIVDRPPAVEGLLALDEISEAFAVEHLGFERAMEALVLALGLRMIGPAMADPDPQAHEPHSEFRIALAARIAPRRAVVHQHGQRQTIATEDLYQALAGSHVLLVAAGLKPQGIARMVVENGERMTAAAADREMALEVHLPQIVGLIALEALVRSRMFAAVLLELAIAAQDGGDGARHRRRCQAGAQHFGDLAAAPGIVALSPDAQHFRFHRRRRPLRARMRPARAIAKPGAAFLSIAGKPLIAFVPADPEAPAQLTAIGSSHQCQPHKFFPLVHDRQLLPWHCEYPLFRGSQSASERVSPMSPNAVTYVLGLYTRSGERCIGDRRTLPARMCAYDRGFRRMTKFGG